MAATRRSSGASLEASSGAKPPSSPTPSARPALLQRALAARGRPRRPIRSASAKVGADRGQTMNSWKSSGLSACAPPLRTLTSARAARGRRRRRGTGTAAGPRSAAAARAAAIDTPRMALAPRRALFVGAVEVDEQPVERRLVGGVRPRDAASAISPLTLPTALVTPLPPKRARRRRAARAPRACRWRRPEGTAARPTAPRTQPGVDLDGRVAAASRGSPGRGRAGAHEGSFRCSRCSASTTGTMTAAGIRGIRGTPPASTSVQSRPETWCSANQFCEAEGVGLGVTGAPWSMTPAVRSLCCALADPAATSFWELPRGRPACGHVLAGDRLAVIADLVDGHVDPVAGGEIGKPRRASRRRACPRSRSLGARRADAVARLRLTRA